MQSMPGLNRKDWTSACGALVCISLSCCTVAGRTFTAPAVHGTRNDFTGELGYAFVPAASIWVAALGRGNLPDLQADVQVSLWSSATQTAIAQQTVGPASPGYAHGGFWFVELAAPVPLLPGVEYVLTQSCTSGMVDKWDDASHPGTISDPVLSAQVTRAWSSGGYPTFRGDDWRGAGMVSFLYTGLASPSESPRAPDIPGAANPSTHLLALQARDCVAVPSRGPTRVSAPSTLTRGHMSNLDKRRRSPTLGVWWLPSSAPFLSPPPPLRMQSLLYAR